MKDKKIFLGGPIQFAFGENGKFNSDIKKTILLLINELKRNEYSVFSAHTSEKFGELTNQIDPSQICLRDNTWMKLCDIYVALIPSDIDGNYLRSDGTYVEIGWASSCNKPIVLILDQSQTDKLSSLVQGLNTICDLYLFDINEALSNTESLIMYIKTIISNTNYSNIDSKEEALL